MTIKVLIVEDSLIVSTILQRMLNTPPTIEVVGVARSGVEGLELIPRVTPDVICTDLHMPKMDGLQFTAEVMATYPRPILVISASVQEEDTKNVFKLLEAGAVDVFPKPRAGGTTDYEAVRKDLINRVRVLAGVRVFTRTRKQVPVFFAGPKPSLPQETKHNTAPLILPQEPVSSKWSSNAVVTTKMVAIGASTGGPQAFKALLGALPANFPAPVVCVQHISEGFLQGFVDWLGGYCALPVQIAVSGEYPQAGKIYFPREKYHLEIDSGGCFKYSAGVALGGHRPSVTVTFNSVAKIYRSAAVGILLTGMGRDGADGMLAISRAGGYTIAQNEETSVVFGMPKEAIALGGVRQILPLEAIAPFLLEQVVSKRF